MKRNLAVLLVLALGGSCQVDSTQPATASAVITHKQWQRSNKQRSHAVWVRHVDGRLVVDPIALGRHLSNIHFGRRHWTALEILWMRESKWNPAATNSSTGACGVPQANPCPGRMFLRSVRRQILWGIHYIKRRYGNPTVALAHSYAVGWY